MGSDIHQSKLMKLTMRYFANYRWAKTIVKSEDMKIRLGLNNAVILPNGVDLNLFRPLNKNEYRQNLGWDLDKKYILFAFNPACPKKTLL
jgi:nucleoside-specific outer membrane channel protein Tsx